MSRRYFKPKTKIVPLIRTAPENCVTVRRPKGEGYGLMNLPAASCGLSKTARNEASFGEFTLRD